MKLSIAVIAAIALFCLVSFTSNSTINMNELLVLNDSNTTSENIRDNKMIIYQMMTRLFGNKNTFNKQYGTIEENGVGKFNDITDKALTELKKLGVTHVWYTGVIEHATLTDYSSYGIKRDDADVVKGRAGSAYAIKDYYDLDPDLTVDVNKRMHEFEALVKRTHKNGLKFLIDFVPNHVARAYHSDVKPTGVEDLGEHDDTSKAFDNQNNFYYIPGKSFVVPHDFNSLGNEKSFNEDGKFFENPAKVTGNNVFNEAPSVNDWFETAKLNYGVDIQNHDAKHFNPVPSTWIKMKDILLYWASKNIDGFRCDMAQMVPVEFWHYAISEVKNKYPNIIFIAEIYIPSQYNDYIEKAGFDLLYDKVGLYDAVRRLTVGHGNVHDITHCWKYESRGISSNMIRFMENHDEQRIASKDFAGNPFKAIPGMVLTATLGSGPVMIYFGQECGEPGLGSEGFGGDDGRTSMFDYWGVPTHQAWMNNGKFDGASLTPEQKQLRSFYAKLLNLSKDNEAIRSGYFYELQEAQKGNPSYNDSLVFSYLRYTNKEKLLIVCNFNQHENLKSTINIPEIIRTTIGLNGNLNALDLLSDKKLNCNENGVEIEVAAMNALIIKLN